MSRNRKNRLHNRNQAVANRANSQLSTGPKTLEGKTASSQNALRHGLTSKQIVLPGENPAEYDAQRESLHREFRPNTETERTLVDEVAACAWRLARARAVETAAYTKLIEGSTSPAEALAEILIDRPKEIANIQRYVTTFERAYYRALNKLTSICKERAKEAQPEEDGFVSQNEEHDDFRSKSIQQMVDEIAFLTRQLPNDPEDFAMEG